MSKEESGVNNTKISSISQSTEYENISNTHPNTKLLKKHTTDQSFLLETSDFINLEKKSEQSIHHQIIYKIKNETLNFQISFKDYLINCEAMSIQPLSKTDFSILYDML